MTGPAAATAGLDGLRAQAIALRRAGLSLRQIREKLGIGNRELLNRLVKGEPPPEWTKRPNAKDDLRERARALRAQGLTYDRIQQELGVSKSSISLWVRDLPKPVRRRTPEEASAISKRAWEPADVPGAERFWAELLGVGRESFGKTVLKRHNPKTVRKNVGETYRGCLVVRVNDCADLYRRIEGWWYGIVVGARPTA